ncbi:MAG: ABC transporter permease subunit [Candidatus Bipolaricaulota bacterium]
MSGALRAELLKLAKRPAVWVLFAVLFATMALFSYLFPYILLGLDIEGSAPTPGQVAVYRASLLPRGFVASSVSGVAGVGGTLALILGVLTMGSEYRWGTLKTITTQRSSRLTLGASKLAGVGIVALLFTIAYFLTALVCSLGIAGLEGESFGLPAVGTIAAGLGTGWLILLTWSALGILLAVAFRGTGLAIGLGLVYQLLLEQLAVALPMPERMAEVLRAGLPGANATALAQHFADVQGLVLRTVPVGQAAAVLAAYFALFVALAGVIFRRRDIT